MTPQQYKRMIDEYNRKAKKHNDQLKRNIDQYNREVKKINQENNRNIQKYNNWVRQFNNSQRKNLEKVTQIFKQSKLVAVNTRTVIYRASVESLENRYAELNNYNSSHHISNTALVVDYPAQEINNSIQLFNSLSGLNDGDLLDPQSLPLTLVEEKLYNISSELGNRWKGAIYSLNPNNPDAARHFCTSVREIFIQLLNIKAPDEKVLQEFPNCLLHEGKPARREKIKYILSAKSIANPPMITFVDADIDDLLTLFRTLNDGTHGSSGTFSVQQLLKIKKRVEDSILFIAALNSN